jgi:hypothetical protein
MPVQGDGLHDVIRFPGQSLADSIDAGTATTISTPPQLDNSRRSRRTPSSSSGDSAAPTGIAARDQLVRLPQTLPSDTIDHGSDRGSARSWCVMVGAASTAWTFIDAFVLTQRSP